MASALGFAEKGTSEAGELFLARILGGKAGMDRHVHRNVSRLS